MDWLPGWSYRKSISLSRAAGAVTDYQMKLLVGESSGAVGEDVDCNNHVLSDFDDLRFTTEDGQTLLDHHIESISGVSPNRLATVWIEFDSIAITDTTFFMYYGFSNVSDPSTIWGRSSNNPVLSVGTTGAWDDYWVAIHSIWKEGATYYAYYNGRRSSTQMQIGLATSSDGVTWVKSGSNPVLAFGAAGKWDDYVVGSPLVWKEDSTWYMLFNGRADATGDVGIGLATSIDGVSWTRYDVDNPVMAVTPAAWDSKMLGPATNMIKEDGTYYLYYLGGDGEYGVGTWKIGLATSTDLHTWTKSLNNPLLSPSADWDKILVDMCVKKFGSTYYMWYQGDDSGVNRTKIGLATSATKDANWVKSGSNPVLDNAVLDWDSYWTEVPVLCQVGSIWRLYFTGKGGADGSAFIQSGYANANMPGGASGVAAFPEFDHFNDGSIKSIWAQNGAPTEGESILILNAASEGIKSVNTYQYKRFRARIKFPANATVGYRNWAGFKTNFDQNAEETAHIVPVGGATTNMYRQTYKAAWQSVNDGGGFADDYVIFQIDRFSDRVEFYYNDVLMGIHSAQIPTANLPAWFMAGIVGSYYSPFYVDWVFVANLVDPEPTWGVWGEEEGIPPVSGTSFVAWIS